MNYTVNQLYVPAGTLLTTGTTESLLGTSNKAKIGFYNPNTFEALASASGVTELFVGFGSGDAKLGSFKTAKIKQSNIVSFIGIAPDTTTKQQITYIGYDEVEDSKSHTFKCDEEYFMTFKIYESYSAGVFQPLIQDSVRIKTACCADCTANCDDIDCKAYMTKAVEDINTHPLLSKYITAELVSKCTGSADTTVFALTLPDPGTNVGGITESSYTGTCNNNGTTAAAATFSTSGSGTGATWTVVISGGAIQSVTINAAGSGYAIGDTCLIKGSAIGGTDGAEDVTVTVLSVNGPEGTILSDLRTVYAAFVDDASTDIVITSDTDGHADSNSTGNIRFELTPSAGVVLGDLEAYNSIAWEEITLTAGTESCVCGIKVTGNALDEFGNTCVPEAVPYQANLVRFKVNVHEGPYSTQDFDIEDTCDSWSVTTTQEIKFPIGEGKAMAEYERHYFRNNLPNVAERGYYMSPIYNNDTTNLLVDTSKTYFQYVLTYIEPSSRAFESKSEEAHSLTILVDTTNTTLANAIEGFLSTFTGTTVNIA